MTDSDHYEASPWFSWEDTYEEDSWEDVYRSMRVDNRYHEGEAVVLFEEDTLSSRGYEVTPAALWENMSSSETEADVV